MNKEYFLEIISNKEREWIKFKKNWFERDELECYISELSNSAAEL